jgi:hypothetical protein
MIMAAGGWDGPGVDGLHCNIREPMTCPDCKAGSGTGPRSDPAVRQDHTEHLARAYNHVGHSARSVRTTDVLVDRNAVTSGTTAAGAQIVPFRRGANA